MPATATRLYGLDQPFAVFPGLSRSRLTVPNDPQLPTPSPRSPRPSSSCQRPARRSRSSCRLRARHTQSWSLVRPLCDSLEGFGGREGELLTSSLSDLLPSSLLVAHSCLYPCADYAKAVEARQRLDAQKTENESVKKVPLLPPSPLSALHAVALIGERSGRTGTLRLDTEQQRLQACRANIDEARAGRGEAECGQAVGVDRWRDVSQLVISTRSTARRLASQSSHR